MVRDMDKLSIIKIVEVKAQDHILGFGLHSGQLIVREEANGC